MDNKIDNLNSKADKLVENTEQTWAAVKELRNDKTELNELRKRIEVLEKKEG